MTTTLLNQINAMFPNHPVDVQRSGRLCILNFGRYQHQFTQSGDAVCHFVYRKNSEDWWSPWLGSDWHPTAAEAYAENLASWLKAMPEVSVSADPSSDPCSRPQ